MNAPDANVGKETTLATENYPQLILPAGFTKGDDMEIEMRGRYPVHVETPDRKRYTLTFYDPSVLEQDLAHATANGEPCFVERNVVVVPVVTVGAMEASIKFLWEHKLFDDLLPEGPAGESETAK